MEPAALKLLCLSAFRNKTEHLQWCSNKQRLGQKTAISRQDFFVDLVVTNWMHVHFVLMVSNQKSEAILMFELESEIW